MENCVKLPAEWTAQDVVLLTWPHEGTDWAPILAEVVACYAAIAKAIMRYDNLVVVCQDVSKARWQLGEVDFSRVKFIPLPTNDTWARDHAPIAVFRDGKPALYDFVFNGWGLKFRADKDNLIACRLYETGYFAEDVEYINKAPFVLEGGSIDTDGEGTILATEACLLSPNRNGFLAKEGIEAYLKETFGVKRVLWLKNGYLAGDDTDSHIDTLARFCSPDTIAYVKCEDPEDEHYEALKAMEEELMEFRQENGEPYRLIALPMADPVYNGKERLPATYANFLIVNNAVLVPAYLTPKDKQAREILKEAFPDRDIVSLNCLPLIKQHGSLHCITMQYPEGFMRKA